MQKLRSLLVSAFLLTACCARSQNAALITKYIDTYKDLAIAEMIRSGVPATITLAQGIYETTAGTSELVMQSNNHFGIKCKPTWTGGSVKHDDDLKNECFRAYPTAADSYRDHSDFLKSGQRYASLFSIDPTDYTAWAYGLKKAGYATSPKYPQALIKLIEDYHLQDYTLIALGKKAGNDSIDLAANNKPDDAAIAAVSTEPAPTYPEGVFRLNNVKVVFAKQGTSYLAIAKQYDVDLSKIFEYNDVPVTEMVDRDQLVYLQKKPKTGLSSYHVVKSDESLWDIAQNEAIRMDALLAFNNLHAGQIPLPGQQLYLKTKAPVAPKVMISYNGPSGGIKTKN